MKNPKKGLSGEGSVDEIIKRTTITNEKLILNDAAETAEPAPVEKPELKIVNSRAGVRSRVHNTLETPRPQLRLYTGDSE